MMKTPLTHFRRLFFLLLSISALYTFTGHAQDVLPPALPWKGKSTDLVVKKDNAWITPVEKSDFTLTPSYQETKEWLTRLCAANPSIMRMTSIGKSGQQRDIMMVIASAEGTFDAEALKKSTKPLLLIQAGIHSGEIDGKDAGMMLLRDIAGGNKKDLLKGVNILFIPILSVDAHERSSRYNRVNQRGPDNMGWRTNARNLNLNRDYAKLDTEEVQAVIGVMNNYDPEMYLDLHVTDGVDFQYDITYGYSENAYSPAVTAWMQKVLSPTVDKQLKDFGHIPGPLIFSANNRDFKDGAVAYGYSPRFSHCYGDLRHLPSILVENHSLKPFKQRVLGTYVFLEGVIKSLASGGSAVQKAIADDRALRNKEVVFTWKTPEKPDTMTLLGVESKLVKSQVTSKEYVEWTGKTYTTRIPLYKDVLVDKKVRRPKAFWVPGSYPEVIERLRLHGIKFEILTAPRDVQVQMYRATDYKFAKQPSEGHFSVTSKFNTESRKETFFPGAVRVDTDQPLGDLAVVLLNPESADSFFQWGFFPEIFNRTEYIEEYAIEPLARNMLAKDEKLRAEFDAKKQQDPNFINNPEAVYEWFYSKSPYVDSRWLLYPVGIEE